MKLGEVVAHMLFSYSLIFAYSLLNYLAHKQQNSMIWKSVKINIEQKT